MCITIQKIKNIYIKKGRNKYKQKSAIESGLLRISLPYDCKGQRQPKTNMQKLK